jgi:hypothetical protein
MKSTNTIQYNEVVKQAYFAILKIAKQLLSYIERDELRYSLIREDGTNTPSSIIHEFVSPLLYLRLNCNSESRYVIHYGLELFDTPNEYSKLLASFIRAIYRLTAKENTTINIECCIHTDWLITNCDELYVYIEDRNKHHTFTLIKYKVTAGQRKRLLSVA